MLYNCMYIICWPKLIVSVSTALNIKCIRSFNMHSYVQQMFEIHSYTVCTKISSGTSILYRYEVPVIVIDTLIYRVGQKPNCCTGNSTVQKDACNICRIPSKCFRFNLQNSKQCKGASSFTNHGSNTVISTCIE